MIPLQKIRGAYERVVIDAAHPVPVFAENQSAFDFGAMDEYCLVRLNFGEMQEPTIGFRSQWHVRGSLVCEIYTRKSIGPGRGMQIAAPVIEALSQLNDPLQTESQEIVARVGEITGPYQRQLDNQPHFFTRFSVPIRARFAL